MKLRHNHSEWVAQRRAQYLAGLAFQRSDDGFCDGGIVPFGAINHALEMERQRLEAASMTPVPARITGWDASGVGLILTCPYCQQEHRHIVDQEEWQPDQPLAASCGRGEYRLAILR